MFGITGSWSEATLTWNSMGSLVPAFYDAYFELAGGNATVYIDVTNLITLGTTNSIAFGNDSSESFSFGTSEYLSSSKRPALVIVK